MTHTDRTNQIITEARHAALVSGQNSSSRVANFSIGWIANRLATAEERIEELEDRPMFLKRQAS